MAEPATAAPAGIHHARPTTGAARQHSSKAANETTAGVRWRRIMLGGSCRRGPEDPLPYHFSLSSAARAAFFTLAE